MQALGDGLYGAEAGQIGDFQILLNDLSGNQMARGGMPITATISDETHLFFLKIIDNDDGSYYCHYVLSKPGIYQLHIRLNDEHEIYGSPFELEIMPSRTIPEKCTAEGEALIQVSNHSNALHWNE